MLSPNPFQSNHLQHKVATSSDESSAPSSSSAAWLESFAHKFFACSNCGNLVQDPVVVNDSNAMACRTCTNQRDIHELPASIIQAAAELQSAAVSVVFGGAHPNSGRKIVKVRRAKQQTSGGTTSPSPGEATKQYFHIVTGANGHAAGVPQPEAMMAAQPPVALSPFASASEIHQTFQGLNPNVELSSQKATHKDATPKAASGSRNGLGGQTSPPPAPFANHQPQQHQTASRTLFPAEDTPDQPLPRNSSHNNSAFAQALEDDIAAQERDFQMIDTRLQLNELLEIASQEKTEVSAEEQLARMDLLKQCKTEYRIKLAKMREGSKMLKNKADEKYESSQYAAAVELYSKAIEAQPSDGLTKLGTLHGNRSAAFYMSGRFQEAFDDCIQVLTLDPEAHKMHQRAAKCAVSLGDLELARSHFSKIPLDKMTPAFTTEYDKVTEGCRVLDRCNKSLGSPDGDESWLMLVALYSEQAVFRVRCAEHFSLRKQYNRAIETLSVLVGAQRTVSVALALAKALYMSGFEYFERARTVLEPYKTASTECRDLASLIEIVDDGKQLGNTLFSQKKFADAANYYTKAINAAASNDQILRILYCNRAAAYKELGKYKEGIEDCSKAVLVDSQFTKAFARRARCHQLLGEHHAAIRDFKSAVKFDPSDADLVEELRRAENLLHEEGKKEKDLYYVLGVTRTATDEQIKSKYKELALKFHPDKCMHLDTEEKAAAEHKFKNIGTAYHTLLDAVKRREYDLKQEKERLAKTSSYTSFFTGGAGGNGASNFGGPSAPHYTRHTSGMPERRAHNFW
ncbi:Hypothetical protein, putative [Bodo saltans]|uniref:J domain-containing protein n=1 Tax=Bodo saltans TaxID=75058 RepID=A0A0S4JUH7_BODSA|nr:Hypothetical protein, putative [Bodo saltans]|eukprot:CUG93032.1 Hypothetical protein, putative [Bodo saltans]